MSILYNFINKKFTEITYELYNKVKEGEATISKKLQIVTMDDDLTRKHQLIVNPNSFCHYNTANFYLNTKDQYYDVGIYISFCANKNQSYVHLINGIKETKDSQVKFVDPTFTYFTKNEIYLVLMNESTNEPLNIFTLDDKIKEYIYTPERYIKSAKFLKLHFYTDYLEHTNRKLLVKFLKNSLIKKYINKHIETLV